MNKAEALMLAIDVMEERIEEFSNLNIDDSETLDDRMEQLREASFILEAEFHEQIKEPIERLMNELSDDSRVEVARRRLLPEVIKDVLQENPTATTDDILVELSAWEQCEDGSFRR
jgi:hypothetical protein